jgi:hypothetical protein
VSFDVLVNQLRTDCSAVHTQVFQISVDYHLGDHEKFQLADLMISSTLSNMNPLGTSAIVSNLHISFPHTRPIVVSLLEYVI